MKYLDIIKDLAENQYGIFSRKQLIEAGLPDSSIRDLLKKGIIERDMRGIYKLLGSQTSWHQRALAATLYCEPHGRLSHESVLVLFGLLPESNDTKWRKRRPHGTRNFIHVTSHRPQQFNENIFFHRSTLLTEIDLHSTYKGIAHVSVERAFTDCAQQLSIIEFDYALDQAFGKRLLTPTSLRDYLLHIRSAPGREKKKVANVLQPYLNTYPSKSSESILEKRVERTVRSICPNFVKQYTVVIFGKRYRLDLAYPEKKLVVEIDGFAHHHARTRFDSDRVRQNDLIAAGWTMIRITAAFTSAEIKQTITKALKSLS